MSTPAPEYVCATVVIRDPIGLHARPAVKITKLAKTFDAGVEIAAKNKSVWVNAKSPSAVMKIKANQGEQLIVRASGAGADSAVAALVDLIDRNFEG